MQAYEVLELNKIGFENFSLSNPEGISHKSEQKSMSQALDHAFQIT